MTEEQFLNRARTIQKKIEKLLAESWPEEWSEQEQEDVADLLYRAKWILHDVGRPA